MILLLKLNWDFLNSGRSVSNRLLSSERCPRQKTCRVSKIATKGKPWGPTHETRENRFWIRNEAVWRRRRDSTISLSLSLSCLRQQLQRESVCVRGVTAHFSAFIGKWNQMRLITLKKRRDDYERSGIHTLTRKTTICVDQSKQKYKLFVVSKDLSCNTFF